MTVVCRSGRYAIPEGRRQSTTGSPARASEVAPALTRLLTDSALYRAAFSGCGVPLAIVDAANSACPVLHVNSAFERAFGIPEAEARGRPFAAALCRDDQQAAERLFTAAGSREPLRVWRKDGTPLEVDASAGPVHDAKGARTHWVVTLADRHDVAGAPAQ